MSASNGSFNGRRKFRNVTVSNPCPSCGKPDWCCLSDDGDICVCRRQGDPSQQKTDKNGETYYLHRLRPASSPSEPQYSLADGGGRLADPQIRHDIYNGLLQCLDLSAQHEAALRARGLKTGLRAAGYRSLPDRRRYRAVRRLIEAGYEQHLPTVPGFHVAEHEGRYWTISGASGLLIPVRDIEDRIIALLVRPNDLGEGGKYRWLSSKKRGGPGPGAPIHVPRFKGDKSIVRVTEGALKADIATRLSGTLTIGLPGVSAWRRAARILREFGATTARVAYDADACHNRNVAECLSNLVNHLRRHGFTVELEIWEEAEGKGIDDLLAAGKQPDLVTGEEAIDSIVKRIVKEAREANPLPRNTASGAPQDYAGFPLTDLGNAERLRQRHGEDLRHCHPWKKWLRWNARYWQEDQTGAITAAAVDTVRGIYEEAAACENDKARGALREHAKKSESARAKRAMIDLGRAQPGIPIMPSEMDADAWLFNVRNGTLDLLNGNLRDHRRQDCISKICPVEYHPNATCPIFEGFLGTIFPTDEGELDTELITFMQRLLLIGAQR